LHEIQEQSRRSTPVKRPDPSHGGAIELRGAPATSALAGLASAVQDVRTQGERLTPNVSLVDASFMPSVSLLSDVNLSAPVVAEGIRGEAKVSSSGTGAAEKLTALRTENSLLSEALQSFLQNPSIAEGSGRRASGTDRAAAAKDEEEAEGGGFKMDDSQEGEAKTRQPTFKHCQE
jgi:hypothetical protein